MAREQRRDVDYFPHSCVHGRKMHIIEATFGNDGYSAWFKLLEQLGKANYHYLDVSDEMNFMFLVSTFKVDQEKALLILNTLAKLGAIDKFLFENYKIIYSEKFAESIKDAYRKRKLDLFEYSDLLTHLGIKNIQTDGGLEEVDGRKAVVIPKEKKSKEKKSKGEENEGDNFSSVEDLEAKYLESKKLIEAVLSVPEKNKISSESELKKLLKEFTLELKSKNIFSKSWDDYTSHFLNWARVPKKSKNEIVKVHSNR